MSINVSFHLNKSKRYPDAKELAIMGRVNYSFLSDGGEQRRQFKFATDKKCLVTSFKGGQVKPQAANASKINSKLIEFKLKAEKLYERYEELKKFPQPPEFRRQLLEETLTFQEERNFEDDFEKFLEYCKNKGLATNTLKNYKRGLTQLREMSQSTGSALNYSNITLNFYGELKNHLRSKAPNTFGRCVKTLITFLNYSTHCEWNKYAYYKHPDFKIPSEKSAIIALTEQELSAIVNLDLSNRPRVDLTRDYYVLASQTGLRYSDLHQLRRENIREVNNGYNIDVTAVKTIRKSPEHITIPLSRLALDIFKKHAFNLEPPPTNQKINENLLVIQQLAKINKRVSSHTGRKTFATLEYKAGTPVPFIMKITGHKTEKEFYKYIGVDKEENADMVRAMHDKYKIEEKGLLNRTLKVV